MGEGGLHMGGCGGDARGIRHIQCQRVHGESFSLQALCRLGGRCEAAASQQHVNACLRKLPGSFKADAPGRAGDKCNFLVGGHGGFQWLMETVIRD